MTGSRVVEIKRTLDGREQRFACTLLARDAGWVALRYVTTEPWVVGGLALPVGTETVGHYWRDRPYTAYHWLDAGGRTLGIYLNAASEVELDDGAVRWQDLALDLLISASGGVEVLDDEEARAAPPWAHPVIARARAYLLAHAAEIAAEVRALTDRVRAPTGERRSS